MIIAIWAWTSDRIIGNNKKLPWKIKEELIHFKKTTLNKKILMGRTTFESIGSKPLKNRENYVLTSKEVHAENITLVRNLDEFLSKFKNTSEELFIIGGCQLYVESLKFCDKLIVSEIIGKYNGDLKLEVDLSDFEIIKTEIQESFRVLTYRRKNIYEKK